MVEVMQVREAALEKAERKIRVDEEIRVGQESRQSYDYLIDWSLSLHLGLPEKRQNPRPTTIAGLR